MDLQPVSPGKVILRIVAAFLLGAVAWLGGIVATIAVVSLSPDPREVPAWLMGLATHSGMLVCSLGLILALSRGRVSRYGFRLPMRFPILRIALLSCGISAVFNVVGWFSPGEGLTFAAEYSLPQTIAFIWVYASVAEEVVTRGLVQSFLAPLRIHRLAVGKLCISVPVLAGAVCFGAMHLMLLTMGIDLHTVLLVVAFTFVGGLVAGYYRERTDSLIPAIVVHALFNVTGSILGLLWQS